MAGRPDRPSPAPPAEYLALADKAQKLMTPDVMKRWRRINAAGATGSAWDVQSLFNGLSDAFGTQTAVDLFEHVLKMHRKKNPTPRGKPAGDHDADRDRLLLKIFDDKDPDSPLSQARRGQLKLRDEPPRPYTAQELADTLKKNPYWGATSSAQLIRRLKHLRKKRRTK